MTYRRAVVTVLLVTFGIMLIGAAPAYAHCHAFTVSAQPSTVSEGGKVTITVTRDGKDKPSSVRLRSVPGSAGAADYPTVDQRVSFTTELSKSYILTTTKDNVAESTERFTLRVSDGEGCDGSGYSYGPDAVVNIQNVAATTTTTQPPTTTTSSTTTSSTTSSTSSTTTSTTTTTAPSTSSSSTTEEDTTTTTEGERTGLREEGGGSWMLPIALSGVAVVAFGGALLARHRLVAGEDVDDIDYDPDGEG